MDALRIGVIGCGGIAVHGHLPAYRVAEEAGLARLVGVCDIDLERARAAARPYGVPAFAGAGDLLAATRPDVVSITTHPASHLALVRDALAAGCHVLCEKPVALSVAEARAMVAAAQRADRLLSICFEYRAWDEALYLRERIAAGDLGHVHAVRTWGGGVHAFPPSPNFHRRAIAGGGVLAHWTIHNLDLALWLLGNPEPLTASAFGWQRLSRLPRAAFATWLRGVAPASVEPGIEDFAVGLVRLAGGTVLTVEANFLQPPSPRPEGWELLGDHAAAALSPIRVWLDRGDEWVDATPAPGTLAPCDYSMDRLIAGFLQAVRTGGPPPVTGAEILRIQTLMDALYASAASGREVAVAEMAARDEPGDASATGPTAGSSED
jgi:predicted dehydrogenase